MRNGKLSRDQHNESAEREGVMDVVDDCSPADGFHSCDSPAPKSCFSIRESPCSVLARRAAPVTAPEIMSPFNVRQDGASPHSVFDNRHSPLIGRVGSCRRTILDIGDAGTFSSAQKDDCFRALRASEAENLYPVMN